MAYLFYLATLLRLLVAVHDDDHGQRQGVHLEIQLTHLNSRRIIKSAEYDHRNKLITATNCTSIIQLTHLNSRQFIKIAK